MPSTTPGHVALNGLELVIQDETYLKQLQTPFNPRFSTGDPGLGDLSYFQYLSMEDWSGGSGQDIFVVNNRFSDSENIDVTTIGELKLAPAIDHVLSLNGPQAEHLNRPDVQEDAWPQIIEWLGQAIIYNDAIEFDAGGVEFLEVFETEVIQDQVINRDTSGTEGVITNESRAEILSISKTSGLPGDSVLIKVKFKNPEFQVVSLDPSIFEQNPVGNRNLVYNPGNSSLGPNPDNYKIDCRIYFGGEAENQVDNFSNVQIEIPTILFTITRVSTVIGDPGFFFYKFASSDSVTIDFTVRVPAVTPGIYKLWTSLSLAGAPYEPRQVSNTNEQAFVNSTVSHANEVAFDTSSNSNVLFFVQSVDQVLVTRKSLYAPQLRASTVIGSKLVGGRVIDSKGYVEVYERQNGAIDRTLQVSLSSAGITPAVPTYMEFVGSNDVLIAAFDNRIYKIDVLTSGLTDAQRVTFIGQVPGDYVARMELWNQRIYIASFDKTNFTSTISWTNGIELQGSYAVDGKFWITDLSNFNGALFYSGGTQDGVGQVKLFPSEKIMELEHPVFDSRIRTLNAGRHLYFGHSHGTGVGTITERGASTWASLDIGDEITNVVWDIEEVGDTVFFFAGNNLLKTTDRYASFGFWESSEIGGNTPLIDKLWNSMTVETETLSGGHRVRVLARNSTLPESQWFVLGEMLNSDGIKKEFFFPDSFQSQWVKIRVELYTEDITETPIIKRMLFKYVPAALTKLQWRFTARADNNLKMLDGTRFPLAGSDISSIIFSMRNIGRVKFRDKDEQEYDVIITDIQESTPLLSKEKGESLVSVEILEA